MDSLSLATVVALMLSITSGVTHPAVPGHSVPVSAHAVCTIPDTGDIAFEGRFEVRGASPDRPAGDWAAIFDEGGGAHAARGFGLSGEIMTVVAGHGPVVTRVELGEPRRPEASGTSSAECLLSEVSRQVRELTSIDVQELGIGQDLVGQTAEVWTSLYGIAWVDPWPGDSASEQVLAPAIPLPN